MYSCIQTVLVLHKIRVGQPFNSIQASYLPLHVYVRGQHLMVEEYSPSQDISFAMELHIVMDSQQD